MVTIRIHGNDYPLALSLRAWGEFADKYGSIDGFNEELRSGDEGRIIQALNEGLKILIKAGAKLADESERAPELPGEPIDYLTGGDITRAAEAIGQAIAGSVERAVETLPKKDGATPG